MNSYNVVEIHQEALPISYTRESATGQFATTGSTVPTAASVPDTNPIGNELVWQTQRHLEQIARDVELSFITGTFAQPTDNTQPRKSRRLLQAIQTNVITNATAKPLTRDIVIDLLQTTWQNGGITVSDTATLIYNAFQKRQLTTAFIEDRDYRERTRNVGGVSLQTIETDFGRLNIMLNRYMPTNTVWREPRRAGPGVPAHPGPGLPVHRATGQDRRV
jgi:hypothetical protein